MTKLLVCLDSSECSMRALEHAINLAKHCDSPMLHLVTAIPEPVVYGEIQVYVTRERMIELERQGGREILRTAEERTKKAGVPFESEVLLGDIPRVLVGRAEELACDGIVMGTRGMGPIETLVMGSIAMKVVHLSKLPVTLVK